MTTINVLALSGSLRRQSFNTALLRAAQEVAPEGMVIDIADLSAIPLYNDDVRVAAYPDAVQALRDRVAAADALLFACPEYNYSVSGVLKNAIDWISRPPHALFDRKPAAIVGAATGLFGTVRGQAHLRQILSGLNADLQHKPEVMVASSATKFDDKQQLTDDTARTLLRDLIGNLGVAVARKRKLEAA